MLKRTFKLKTSSFAILSEKDQRSIVTIPAQSLVTLLVGDINADGFGNPDVRQQNVDAAIQFCRAMRPPSERIQYKSSGTPTGLPALESFYGLES